MEDKVLNPQQQKFLSYYLDPQSETFSNARQSALRAEYTQEYAENIMSLMPKWLKENLEDSGLIAKALANLSDFIDGESSEPGERKIKWDATKFTLERLNKKFKQSTDITSGGKPIIQVAGEIAQKNNDTQ